MRILMLSDFYPPVVGGLERVVADLSRDLVARGHAVAVATLGWGDGPPVENDRGVQVHRLRGLTQRCRPLFRDPRRRFTPPAPDPLLARALAALVEEWRPDIVHAHGWLLYSYLPIKGRIPLVATLHDYGNFCVKRDLLYGDDVCDGPAPGKCLRCAAGTYGTAKALAIGGALALGSRWHGRIDQFLAVSRFVATAAARHLPCRPFPREEPIPVIPSFIADDVARYQPPATRSPALPDGDFILFVGALGRHKGVHTLLEAHGGLAEAPQLVLIGGSLGEPLDRVPDGVRVIRDAPHELVLEAWARCRVGVVPSLWAEPLGLVALEALALGRPLIASRIGGLTDIVEHDRGGLLVPPGDAAALREALRALLDDPGRGARLGAAGRRHVLAHFTAAAVVPQLEEVYARVLERSSRPAGAGPALAAGGQRSRQGEEGTPT